MQYRDLFLSVSISLKGNILRSFLSSLGVFMGVFAISGTLQVSDIGKSYLEDQVKDVEAPQLMVYAPWDPVTYERVLYQPEDLEWLKSKLSGWQKIAIIEDISETEIYAHNEKINVKAQAVDPYFLEVTGRKMLRGSFFSETDFRQTKPVVLVDPWLAQKLFKGQNPIGKKIDFNGKSYYIKGLVQLKRSNTWETNQGTVILPLSVYQSMNATTRFSQMMVRPQQEANLEQMKVKIKELIKQRYPNLEILDIWSNVEDIEQFEKIMQIVTWILLLIGGIALFVGGVGIANITIASVVERTSEIGLRRAIGATKPEIMLQFLLESTLISLIGGVTAIVTVQGITILVILVMNLPYQFNYRTPLISLSSATAVGLVASFLPALRASQLDPVNALSAK